MKIEKDKLITLLRANKREAFIGKKKTAQCESCVITSPDGAVAHTLNIVKDGVSTLHSLRVPILDADIGEFIPVASIESMLGILKHHKCPVTLASAEGKLRVKSRGKQTTLLSSENAFAYSGARLTINEQLQKAQGIADRIDVCSSSPHYTTIKGDIYAPDIIFECDTKVLQEALYTNTVNNQNISTVELCLKRKSICLVAGDDLKGRTESVLLSSDDSPYPYEYEFGGGLENASLLEFIGEKTKITIFDFHDTNGMVVLGFSCNESNNFFIVLGKRCAE